MNSIGVVIQGTSPLHLHRRGELRSSGSHRCLMCDGRPTIDAFEILAAIERAAFEQGGPVLSLLVGAFIGIAEPRIAIASRHVRLGALGLATDRSNELLYAGMTFDEWHLEFALEIASDVNGAYGYRHLLKIAGRDLGLGYQVDGVDLGRFVVREWNPPQRVVGRNDSPMECAR